MSWYRRSLVTAAVVTLGAGAVAGAAAGADAGEGSGPPPSSAYRSHLTIVTGPVADVAQARELWRDRGPADYRFVWWTSAMVGTSRTDVEVRGGRAVSTTPLEGVVPGEAPPGTVDEAFTRVDEVEREASATNVDYDPALGYPRSVDVDEIGGAIDDEHSFGVESVRPL